ncbi:uncharacterized protein BDR25DRAFT_364016, partial [Lindgomyces ingoldianus]
AVARVSRDIIPMYCTIHSLGIAPSFAICPLLSSCKSYEPGVALLTSPLDNNLLSIPKHRSQIAHQLSLINRTTTFSSTKDDSYY